ncbi:MAG: hypothetical protein CL678_12750 [Bdellovibrionaceae bacterium]|nr:hypothetical protein [Pseudobdellovibrionaceae bacterium]|tara:strand:+ start:24 stop:269 length:246 start_codon:yes stop_codon:yes gene_type:complete
MVEETSLDQNHHPGGKPVKTQNSKKQDSKNTEQEADVLYQKIAGKWYAFSVVDEDVFMGEVPEETFYVPQTEKPFSPENKQ